MQRFPPHRLFLKWLLVAVLSSAAFLVIAAPTSDSVDVAKRPADHIHGEEQCQTCHKAALDIKQWIKQSGDDCLRCHSENVLSKGFVTETASSVSFAESELTVFAPDSPIASDAGMRYPLYSQKSRLGGEPNPMVKIPSGPFIRGTNNRLPDEAPQHTWVLPEYLIDVFEVTNFQYKHFIDNTGRRSPDHFRNRTHPAGKADHPVIFVTWSDAKAYCNWAGKRLPTDKEWEKAARGEKGRIFPWGDDFDATKANTPVRWKVLGEPGDTSPVGAFSEGVSPYGLYDMTGNVWEWTSSWYKAYPGNTVPSENYGERYKTLKGGSWFDCSFYKCGLSAPLYNRSFFSVRTKNDSFGFRCAKDVASNSE